LLTAHVRFGSDLIYFVHYISSLNLSATGNLGTP
jgi:hypothetical protein